MWIFPVQAVQTNVIGTDNVLEAAINHNVKKVIVLSTDKAAYPINAMGMSKATMEKVAVAKGRNLGKNGYDVYYTQTKNFRDNKVYLYDIMKNMRKLEKILKTNNI